LLDLNPTDGGSSEELKRSVPFAQARDHSLALLYWTRLGIRTRAARSLVEKDLFTIESLRQLRREDLLLLRGLGEKTLGQIEATLQAKLPSGSTDYWRRRGINPLVAHALRRAGIRSLKQLGSVTREEFLSHRGLSRGALAQCETLLGRPLPSSRQAWSARGLSPWMAWKLSCSRILTFDDLSRLSAEQLQQLGFSPAEAAQLDGLSERNSKVRGGAPGRAPFRRGRS
jgi:hypothetical protein